MIFDPCLTLFTKINSKYITNLNIRCETVKLLDENIGENFLDISLGNDFFMSDSKAQATKAKINKWDYIKLNSFSRATK